MPSIPRKLKRDFILEAVAEVRFGQGVALPEVVMARLLGGIPTTMTVQRLPLLDVPSVVRNSTAELRYQPLFEAADKEHNCVIKLGPFVVSIHNVAPYWGWDKFCPAISTTLSVLFSNYPDIPIERVGLRYINAIDPEHHPIEKMSDLEIQLTVGGRSMSEHVFINYKQSSEDNTDVMVRIASPDFAVGNFPSQCIGLIDVDVFTPKKPEISSLEDLTGWLDRAHVREKEAFFELFKEENINQMMEE